MNKTFISILFYIIIIFIAGLALNYSDIQGSTTQIISYIESSINYETETVIVDASFPQFTGFDNPSYEEDLNSSIKGYIEHLIRNYKLSAESSKEDFSTKGWDYTPYSLTTTFQVYNTIDILSLGLDILYVESGTPKLGSIFFNIHLDDTPEDLQINQLFKAEYDYASIINKEIKRKMAEQMEDDQTIYYFEEDKHGFIGITDYQKYYIKDNSLYIVFDKNTIAPGSMGEIQFEIPLSYFKNQLAF
ncbi:RsiV family protein [Vallitalea okinawensis]|uniref:RsiV family protein n=1 Tax=Vallitalea okinawensis TaxID=2078660 RepID=UPI00147963D2|nr:RsiV family protein [Vallitalea okinawensis]